jgi:hypothetical protein
VTVGIPPAGVLPIARPEARGPETMFALHIAAAFGGILSMLPTDPASIFVIVLMVVSFAAVLWFGRSRGGKDDKPA